MQGSAPMTASPTPRRADQGLRDPSGIQLHSPNLSRHARPLNHYLRHEAGTICDMRRDWVGEFANWLSSPPPGRARQPV